MRHVLAAVLVVMPMAAAAQEVPQITVRPEGGGTVGGEGYVGPYGRNLPGVSMFAGRAVPATPTVAFGGVKIPSYQKIPNEYTYSQSVLPILDAWHGTLSPGFPF